MVLAYQESGKAFDTSIPSYPLSLPRGEVRPLPGLIQSVHEALPLALEHIEVSVRDAHEHEVFEKVHRVKTFAEVLPIEDKWLPAIQSGTYLVPGSQSFLPNSSR